MTGARYESPSVCRHQHIRTISSFFADFWKAFYSTVSVVFYMYQLIISPWVAGCLALSIPSPLLEAMMDRIHDFRSNSRRNHKIVFSCTSSVLVLSYWFEFNIQVIPVMSRSVADHVIWAHVTQVCFNLRPCSTPSLGVISLLGLASFHWR